MLKPGLTRSLFYALNITLGGLLALQELYLGARQNFFLVNLAVVIIFVIELYTSRSYHRNRQILPPGVLERKDIWLHHFIVPVSAYFSLVGFTYFNRDPYIIFAMFVISLAVFTVLFTNIQAFYSNLVQLELSTHYVYDIVKLLIFFWSANLIINMVYEGYVIVSLCLPIISIGMMVLLAERYGKLERSTLNLIIQLTVVINLLAFAIVFLLGIPSLLASLGIFLIFYLGTAVVYHYMHQDLNKSLIAEYATTLVLALLLIYFISTPR